VSALGGLRSRPGTPVAVPRPLMKLCLLGALFALSAPLLTIGCTTPDLEIPGRLAVQDHLGEPVERDELADLLRGVQIRNTDSAKALVDYGYALRIFALDPDRTLREGLGELLPRLARALETVPRADDATRRTAEEIRALAAPPAGPAAPVRPPAERSLRALALASRALSALAGGPYREVAVVSARATELDGMVAALELRGRDLTPQSLVPAFRRALLALQTMLLSASVIGDDLPAAPAASPPPAPPAPPPAPAPSAAPGPH
jgi:hypothetical protein